MSKIILASASPRRRELLTQIGLKFEIMPSHKEEVMSGVSPAQTVMELAVQKAEDIFEQTTAEKDEVLVIGADTVVAVDENILGKPKDEADALRMLLLLQGRTHQVYTGVCLKTSGKSQVFYGKTDVSMYPASEEELRAYIRTGEPMDKAGSYAIQGLGSVFIREIHGDYNNVVGLPVAEIWQRLRKDENIKNDCI
jgi:septum formation protein